MITRCYYHVIKSAVAEQDPGIPEDPILSQTAEYALRAVVHIARYAGNGPVHATELAAATDVPENYLRKVLHELVRGGVLQSSRGKNGGFQLAVPADELSLLTVVCQFDRLTEQRRCLLGRAECSDVDPCPMHHRWKAMAEQLARFFGGTTIADVAADGAEADENRRRREDETTRGRQ